MKKKIILLLLSIIFSNCSILEKKNEFDNPYYKKAIFFYDKWDIKNAILELENIKFINDDIKNLKKKLQKRKLQKQNLIEAITTIKEELKKNNFNKLSNLLKKNLANNIKIKKLKENDFSNLNIYSGKIKFNKNYATILILFNYLEESIYYEIEFEILKGKWKIKNIKERR